MKLKMRNFIQSTRGTVLVEAAIALPMLLVLFSVVAELGRFFYIYNTLSKATYASARYMSKRPLLNEHLTIARNIAVYGGIANNGAPILPGLTGDNIEIVRANQIVTVSIRNYAYTPIFAMGELTNLAAITITPATTTRYLVTNEL